MEQNMKPDGFLVFCLNDDNCYVLATRMVFPTEDEADEYAESECINQDRKPITVAWNAKQFSTLRNMLGQIDTDEQKIRKQEQSFEKAIPPEVTVDGDGKHLVTGSPEFWEMIAERRKQPGIPMEEVVRQLEEENKKLYAYLGLVYRPHDDI